MPLMRCTTKQGTKGWKFGKSGKCYSKKSDAEKQMRAIKANSEKSLFKQFADVLLQRLKK